MKADAVLMCSRNEAWGRVVAEAMATCRPVIGHDKGGVSELILNNRTGLLYTNGFEELADCMSAFVANPTWAKSLGENVWHVAREEYTIEKYASRIYDVLLSVLNRQRESEGQPRIKLERS